MDRASCASTSVALGASDDDDCGSETGGGSLPTSLGDNRMTTATTVSSSVGSPGLAKLVETQCEAIGALTSKVMKMEALMAELLTAVKKGRVKIWCSTAVCGAQRRH